MSEIKKKLTVIPACAFTIVTILLILWLTLVPDPLGDDAPQLFEGADKVVHSIMFGFLTVMILLDRQRKTGWKTLKAGYVAVVAACSSLFGIGVEFAQLSMQLGRGFEISDMIADTLGAALCGFLWLRLQKYWSSGR